MLNIVVGLSNTQAVEFGLGGGRLYSATIGPMSRRPGLPSPGEIGMGEDHWAYYPDVAGDIIHFNLPFWPIPTLILALAIVGAVRHTRRGLLIAEPSCKVCGYNLTGNVSGVCPECGRQGVRSR